MMAAPLAVGLAILLGLAAWLDFRQRRIPNGIVAAVTLLGIPFAATAGPVAGLAAAATATGVLCAGIGVWKLGWLGGGDVKLIAALSLWSGPDHLAGLLLAITLSGGLLALAVCAARHPAVPPVLAILRVGAGTTMPAAPGGVAGSPGNVRGSVPYGVAIAVGGAWLLQRLFLA
jgi:prepilin peptidase CpaA